MIRKCRVWAWYWLGDTFSKVLNLGSSEWWAEIWYPAYSFCMLRSSELDVGCWMWTKAPRQNEVTISIPKHLVINASDRRETE